MPKRRLQLTADMVSGYQAGTLSSYQIAETLGCSQQTVLTLLRDEGVNTSRNRGHEPRITIPPSIAIDYRLRRIGIVDVAAALGCSTGGARKALLRAGLAAPRGAIHPRGATPGVRARGHLRKLLRWLTESCGYTHRQLARIMEVHVRTVANLLSD